MDNSNGSFKCNQCKKYYSSYKSIWNHNKKFHNKGNTNVILEHNLSNTSVISGYNLSNTSVIQSNTNVLESQIQNSYNCSYCNREFNMRQYRWKHEKICKNKVNLIEENNKLKIENENLKMQIIPVSQSNNNIVPLNSSTITTTNSNNVNQTNNGTINNGTINNNQNNNIQNNSLYIAQLGSEKINYKAKDIRKIARDGLNGAITCVQRTHFDKDKPENHSFLTSSLAGHYCTAINHKTQKPETVPKKDLFWIVLGASFKILEGIAIQLECNSDLREQIPVNEQEKLSELIKNKHKFFEKKNWNSFYESINSMSYNYKDLILSTWNTLKVPEIESVESDTESEPEVKVVTEFNDSDSDDDFNILTAI